MTLLELIEVLKRRGRSIGSGKIVVDVNNRKVCRRTTKMIWKAIAHTQDAGAEISQIKKLLREIKFEIEF